MTTDKSKIEVAMARKFINDKKELAELAGVSYGQVKRSWTRAGTRPGVVGKIARALGVDVLDILADEPVTKAGAIEEQTGGAA